ncbi:dipeptide epimerase [Agaricicola taiwanensis]|uniref:Dipeptide epimerase n=1 Tax=Agaricicola taiwanensis TaxID=591372 RepID=A0A8J2YHI3_9RHOB|nr:N-acetyl-D-Glu racemase DgcA [Agaricicola taiwanensis]GGE43037.1 dipeptide epimerase [Agaricicola taiwanensis]
MTRRLSIRTERWPIAGRFTIARGSKTEAVVVVAEISDGTHIGRGECVPYARYGETVEGTAADILGLAQAVADGMTRNELQKTLPSGAARNALDCAFWDLEAKLSGKPAWSLAGLPEPQPRTTAYTLSLGTPDEMAEAAAKAAHRPLLKVKLGAAGDPERIAAIRKAAPKAELIVDANEGWTGALLEQNLTACAAAGVILIEQPLPATEDDALMSLRRPVPVCADESAHDRAGLSKLSGKYDAINIKLDKTGGLTEALALQKDAEAAGLQVMVGCMLATSLAMAPAFLLAQTARFIDLDGPLLLSADRPGGIRFEDSLMHPPSPDIWG